MCKKEEIHAEFSWRMPQFGQSHSDFAAMLRSVIHQMQQQLPERQLKDPAREHGAAIRDLALQVFITQGNKQIVHVLFLFLPTYLDRFQGRKIMWVQHRGRFAALPALTPYPVSAQQMDQRDADTPHTIGHLVVQLGLAQVSCCF